MEFIITDIDECVLSYHDSFERWIRNNPSIITRMGIYFPKETDHLSLKHCIENWLECSTSQASILIEIFSSTDEFRNLPPSWESDIYIPKLYDLGYKFIAITSAGKSQSVRESRMINLERYFPNMFIACHCIDWSVEKKEYLSLYRPTWWVEDRIPNALMGKELGFKTFLVDNPHNQDNLPCGIKRVKSWKEIYQCITEPSCVLGWMC